MLIAKGIKGIRNFLATRAVEQTPGWHVFVNGQPSTFQRHTAEYIITNQSWHGRTFIGWTGNGLFFTAAAS